MRYEQKGVERVSTKVGEKQVPMETRGCDAKREKDTGVTRKRKRKKEAGK